MAKILVVDDSEDSQHFVSEVLGYEHEIFTLADWTKTTDYILQYEIDLILMDINMPGLPGDVFTKVLRKHIKSRPLNIVLFSSIDESELRRRSLNAGAKGYIAKTPNKQLLRHRIHRFLHANN